MPYQNLLTQINETPRRIVESRAFTHPTNVCLLDFVGAPDYFITEYGMVWNRYEFNGRLYGTNIPYGWVTPRWYDPFFRLPWIHIAVDGIQSPFKFSKAGLLLPIPHLLAWAFCPSVDRTRKHVVHKNGLRNVWPKHHSELVWADRIDMDRFNVQKYFEHPHQKDKNIYLEFIRRVYGED